MRILKIASIQMPIGARERSDAICKLRYLSNYQILQYSNTMQFLEYRIRIPIADMEKEYNTILGIAGEVPFQVQVQVQGHSRGLRLGDGGTVRDGSGAIASW